jgi:hypothetical protein
MRSNGMSDKADELEAATKRKKKKKAKEIWCKRASCPLCGKR